jgi:gamma-glutamyltranspeptidase/glutathione hydrolase
VKGTYRGYDIIAMPLPTSGGVTMIEILNLLEGYDLAKFGAGSAAATHVMAESMKRAYADRARYLGDPDFNRDFDAARLISKDYAANLRKTINLDRASPSAPTTFDWPHESDETTHIAIVDAARNAVSMTYTLEQGYGVKAVLPGGGFLLNNEMGDFNAAPGLTNADGLIGTDPNLAAPGKRMLSSMAPTILTKGGELFMVTGSPGGRTIINTVLETIVDVIDFGMNAQEAVDAPRFHHQWLPDRITYERQGFSPDTLRELERRGHTLQDGGAQGAAQVIIYNAAERLLEGATDHRVADGAAVAVRSK